MPLSTASHVLLRNPRMFKLFFGPRPCLAVTHPELAREVLTRPKESCESKRGHGTRWRRIQEFTKTNNDKVARHSISAPLNYTKVPWIARCCQRKYVLVFLKAFFPSAVPLGFATHVSLWTCLSKWIGGGSDMLAVQDVLDSGSPWQAWGIVHFGGAQRAGSRGR